MKVNSLPKIVVVGLLFLMGVSCSKKEEGQPTPGGGNGGNPSPSTSYLMAYGSGPDSTLEFGRVFPNHQPRTQLLTLFNASSKSLTVSNIILPDGFFFSDPFSSTTLEPYDKVFLTISFLPRSAKSYSGTIAIQSDADEGDNAVAVTAEGSTKAYDFDGNEYNVIKIGSQLWLKENFRGTHYENGDPIPSYSSFSNPQDDILYGKMYPSSAFYIWSTPAGGLIRKGQLIKGFRTPVNSDWEELFSALGGKDVAGGKMKQSGTSVWQAPNTGATNESDFTALPAGSSVSNGTVYNFGDAAFYWSFKNDNPQSFDYIYKVSLYHNTEKALIGKLSSSYHSVRLVSVW
jgi:uncharacterized protein (TIGR02145 family)